MSLIAVLNRKEEGSGQLHCPVETHLALEPYATLVKDVDPAILAQTISIYVHGHIYHENGAHEVTHLFLAQPDGTSILVEPPAPEPEAKPAPEIAAAVEPAAEPETT